MKRFCFFFYILTSQVYAYAQISSLDSLLRASSYQIHINENGQLTGPGTTFIMEKAADAQFVMIGENHNTREIPEFTTSLFNELHAMYGFNHLALEQDPLMMRKVSAMPYKGNRDSVFSLARRYPYGYTFISDQELSMIADISKYPVKGNSIWGCDQSFGMMQSFDEIKAIKGDKAIPDSIVNMAANAEAIRDLDNKHFEKTDFTPLYKLKTGNPDNEIDFDISSLVMSDSIYNFMFSKRPNEGCTLREAYMKSRFMDEYKKSVEAGEVQPKVLLKLGTSHILYGFEPNTGALNLGTFVKEFAIANGKEAFSINAMIYRTDTSDWNYNLYDHKTIIALFARNASVDSLTIFDLAPLKAFYYNDKMKGVIPKEEISFFENYILAFDAFLLLQLFR